MPKGRSRPHSVFLLLGEPLAIDLVNTLVPPAYGGDLVATRNRVLEWLQAEAIRLPADGLELPQVEDLVGLREALRSLFSAALDGTTPPVWSLRIVNSASRAGARYVELEWTAGVGPRARAHPARRRDGGRPGVALLAEIARSGIELLGGPDRDKLRRCGGPGCSLLFVATNLQRRWCAAYLCGNRVRVARHYDRTRRTGFP